MANVEEDADEAANLENLSGSHFKVNNIRNNSGGKYLRIKTEQYFSKIENRIINNAGKKYMENYVKMCDNNYGNNNI